MNNELGKCFEQFAADIAVCCYDDQENVIPGNVGNVISVMNAYAKYLESASKMLDAEKRRYDDLEIAEQKAVSDIEIAKIKSEADIEIARIKAETDLKIAELNRLANFEVARTRSRGDGIVGLAGVIFGAVTEVYRGYMNRSNLKAVIYASEVANKILDRNEVKWIKSY